jgi:dipeptidyl aminopeptidase/acylaminoacyl peptidase
MLVGYTVLDIDYRGSDDGYGRDFRTGIYRFMEVKIYQITWMVKNTCSENHGIDASKVGIYGGSYGGFITLMGMLTGPKSLHLVQHLDLLQIGHTTTMATRVIF